MSTSTLLHASAHDTGLPAGSVHMIATSPPYWGLRKYAGDQDVEWPTVTYTPMAGLPEVTVQGCEPGCQHEWGDLVLQREQSGRSRLEWTTDGDPAAKVPTGPVAQGAYCVHCGGWRGPLGLEPDLLAYVGHLVLVFREVWRVLRNDGTCFVNLGDSYNGSGGAGGDYNAGGSKEGQPKFPGRKVGNGLKPKDLCMIPARVSLALQADGWTLRSAIVWAKGVSFLPDYAGSVMPESVTDRPTKAHEMVYLLSKRAKYYYDALAVAEQSTGQTGLAADFKRATKTADVPGQGYTQHRNGRESTQDTGTRNLRDVWVINPANYPGSHFAVWPEDLVRPMVLAGSSARGVCPVCAAPWRRVVERTAMEVKPGPSREAKSQNGELRTQTNGTMTKAPTSTTIGWSPSCTCAAGEPVPATVLDPFSGSGTTGRVALALGRNYIGVDIAGEYHDTLAVDRLSNLQMEMTL